MSRFEKKMEKHVKDMTSNFIKEMQENYKIDCLSLGWVAAATYGRGTDVHWNKIVTDSEIVVNVEILVDKMGRCDY
ncbi:Ger(x)C family spore germination C-terminal domain-containing protein [Mycoplasmatota bacterium WC44]